MSKADKAKAARKLANSSVGIAGIGGLGSNVALALARAGVGRLVVVDFDDVEESNLNRQAYTLDQVGMRKTEALTMNISRVNPKADVTAFHYRLEPGRMADIFSSVDVVIEALDSAQTKSDFIEEISMAYPDKPLIAASGVSGIKVTGRIEIRKSGNLSIVQDEKAPSCENSVVLAPKVGLFAHWQASLALEILLEGINVD